MSFQGQAGYVRLCDGSAVIALLSSGRAAARGLGLECGAAAALRVADEHLVLHTNGKAQTVKLSGNLPGKGVVEIDGSPVQGALKGGVLSLSVPEGQHEVLIK